MYQVMTERFESDPDRVIDYASLDAWAAFRCATRLKQELKRVRTWAGNTLWDIFCWYEVPLTRILFEMERIGIRLDVDYLASTKPQIVQRRSEIEAAIAKIAGHIVNIDSPPQLVRLFFTELQLEPLEMTKGGENKAAQPSTSKTVLKSIASQGGVGGDVAQLVLEHRALGKMLGTYVHGLLGAVDDKGRVHTTFNQHVADTGRLSSSEPNLQNQIRSGSAFLNIRKAFIASPGCMLGVADYDQLEMYVLGHFSKDRGLIDAARSGRDIHAALTELIYGDHCGKRGQGTHTSTEVAEGAP
jgi:DNA polymerase-1